jgi:hypothetical protein
VTLGPAIRAVRLSAGDPPLGTVIHTRVAGGSPTMRHAPAQDLETRPSINWIARVAHASAGVVIGLALVLAACGQEAEPTASVPTSVEPSVKPTSAASSTTETEEPTPSASIPSASLPPFACETLVIEADGEVDQAVITDVRVGTHADYDRVVFEFNQGRAGGPPGVPAYSLEYVGPPLTEMPSDLPMEVPGGTFMKLVLQGGTKLDEDYHLVYDGTTRFDPGYPMLVALYESGDFEAVSAWYLGLDREPCIRVFTLAAPPRLVIDLQH